MTQTEQFCRIIRDRSNEHVIAGQLLFNARLYGQVISILRQELDSLVRVIYLLGQDSTTKQHFINQTLQNTKWTIPNSRTKVTDRDMVDFANRLHHWTNSVYKLGCAFIHLSPLADYNNSNPFDLISQVDREAIKQHLHQYHGFRLSDPLNMSTITPFLLRVLDKVSNNLSYYIGSLENNSTDSDDDI